LSYVEKHFGREDFRFRCDSVNIWPADSALNGHDDGRASRVSTLNFPHSTPLLAICTVSLRAKTETPVTVVNG